MQKNLCGGEIIDLLEDKYQKAVRDRQELQLLVKEAWKIFFEIAGTWISYGQLEDANREFFVWPTKGIKSVDVELLLKFVQFILVKFDVFPEKMVRLKTDIFSSQSSVPNSFVPT